MRAKRVLLGDETVFQRLYDDGLIRVARLEKLREKVRKERNKLGYADKDEAKPLPGTQVI